MKLTPTQRRILLAGLGILLSVLLFVGGFHHHDGDAGPGCWYCVTATMALLPIAVLLFTQTVYSVPARLDAAPVPAWFLWVSHHRRGPPARSHKTA